MSSNRCIHRHTKRTHPACFAKGIVKDSAEEKLPWYEDGCKIGYLDIETANGFSADFGMMLSWCIKEKGGKITSDVITKAELFSYRFDRRIVQSLCRELKKYDIIVTYYGTMFDIPYTRAKALHYGFDFPEYGDLYHFDLFYLVKSKLKLSRKSLDRACSYLGIEGKTHLDADTWIRASYGDKKALKYVLEHNEFDVDILEKLHDRLIGHRKWIKKSL